MLHPFEPPSEAVLVHRNKATLCHADETGWRIRALGEIGYSRSTDTAGPVSLVCDSCGEIGNGGSTVGLAFSETLRPIACRLRGSR